MEKIRVVEFTEAWTPGGVESYIVNIADSIDKEKFDIIIWATQVYASLFDADLKRLGKELYNPISVESFPNPIKRTINGMRIFRETIKSIKCDVLHLHASNGVAWIYAYMAKKNGVKKVVFHAHSSYLGQNHRTIKLCIHEVCKYLFSDFADVRIACSEKAANFLYTKRDVELGRIRYVNCIIDVEKFKFDAYIRNFWRKKYNIHEEETVFIHVGRFQYEKNHVFLVKLFNEISAKIPSKLILIGEGREKKKVKKMIEEFGIAKNVIFIEKTREVQNYMFMADAFLLPSFHEGNPIVTAEAQASGLTCYISKNVTQRAKLIETTQYIDISDEKESANKIIDDFNKGVWQFDRVSCNNLVREKGYDKKIQISELQEIYS